MSIVPKSDTFQETPTHYTMPAIKSIQGGKPMYVTELPMRHVPKFIPPIDELDNVEDRCQRLVNKNRAKKITRYILENPETYVLPALTVSVISKGNHRIEFTPFVKNGWVGTLAIPKCDRILINDGQHRRLGIEYALQEVGTAKDTSLGSIPVTIYAPVKEEDCRQIFTDINLNAVKPSGSINTLYNQRDLWAQIAVGVANVSRLFKDHTEFEKGVVSAKSDKWFTLTTIQTASKYLFPRLGDVHPDVKPGAHVQQAIEQLSMVFDAICQHVDPFPQLILKPEESEFYRKDFLSMNAVVLEALAIYIHEFLRVKGATNDTLKATIKSAVKKLESVDWTRDAYEWEGRCVHLGRIQKNKRAIELTASHFMGLAKIEPPLHIAEMEYQLSQQKKETKAA